MFALLAVAFAFSFVVAGVGSGSTGFGSVIDAFGGLFGRSSSSSGLSISKSLKRTQQNPKDAAAWLDLAHAYKAKNEDIPAIAAYETFVKLRPRNTTALAELIGLYQNQVSVYSQAAQAALSSQQSPLAPGFGPPSTSIFGRALSDPIQQAVSSIGPSAQYQQFAVLAQQASQNLENTYRRLAAADPTDPSFLLQYARAAQTLGDTTVAVDSYRSFLKRFPDDPNVRYVQAQLKQLTGK